MTARLFHTRGDILLAAAFAVAAVLEISLRRLDHEPALLTLGALVPLSLAWRVRAPVLVLAANLVALIGGELIASRDEYPVSLGVVALVATYSAAAHTRDDRSTLAAFLLVPGVLVAVAVEADWETAANVAIALIVLTLLFRGAWLLGRWAQSRRDRRHQRLLERDAQARAALQEERARIARELHDVLAHAISVIVLQARGARHALADQPADARGAIDAIERTATQALAEMRRLLTVLRVEDEAVALAPQPSLAHLEALVGQVRAAGLAVDLRVEGDPRDLPPGVDLCAYRIVQEALTNALKHAGPATAAVLLRYRVDELEVEVADTGAGGGNGDIAGLGLAGMQERVAVFGGLLESGPRPEGGYLVRARLPL